MLTPPEKSVIDALKLVTLTPNQQAALRALCEEQEALREQVRALTAQLREANESRERLHTFMREMQAVDVMQARSR